MKKREKMPYESDVSHTYPLAEVNRAFEESEWKERQTNVSRSMLFPELSVRDTQEQETTHRLPVLVGRTL